MSMPVIVDLTGEIDSDSSTTTTGLSHHLMCDVKHFDGDIASDSSANSSVSVVGVSMKRQPITTSAIACTGASETLTTRPRDQLADVAPPSEHDGGYQHQPEGFLTQAEPASQLYPSGNSNPSPPYLATDGEHANDSNSSGKSTDSNLIGYVEETTEVILPPNFFQFDNKQLAEEKGDGNPGGSGKDQDAISRLATLISNAGGEDKSGIFKIYSTYNSPWRTRVKITPRDPPPYTPRDDASVSSASSEFSMEEAAQVQMNQANASHQNSSSSSSSSSTSLAKDVFVDSRYFQVHAVNGRIEVQDPQKIREVFGPLDKAKFRDYRIYPVDYHLTGVKGLNSKEKPKRANKPKEMTFDAETTEEEVSDELETTSRGRKRRRVQRFTVEQAGTIRKKRSPPKDEKEHVASRVGGQYQAVVPARPLSVFRQADSSYTPQCEQLWDPQLADAAEARGEDINTFLSQSIDLNSKTLLMEALHKSGYNVAKATDCFINLYRQCKEPCSQLCVGEINEQVAMMKGGDKDFYAISKKMGRSVSSVLVQYYQFKGQNLDGQYTACKTRWNNESDWCNVCQDGGQLIVCEHCHKAYHLKCLDPPLKRIPRGEWLCRGCLKSPAKLNRASFNIVHGLGYGTSDSPIRSLSFATDRQQEVG